MADGEARLALLPDCGGTIAHVAICLPPALLDPQAEGLAAGLRDALGCTLAALPEGVTATILCERRHAHPAARFAAASADACAIDIAAAADDGTMRLRDVWIQDSLLVAVDADGRRTYVVTRSDNRGVHAHWLARHDGAAVIETSTRVTGGDVLGAEDGAILLGHDADGLPPCLVPPPRLHRFGYGLSENSGSATRGANRSSKDPDPVAQPGGHVDLHVALPGVAIGGRPVCLVASPTIGRDPAGPPYAFMQGPLDACARRLERDGFAVLRNPAAYGPRPGRTEIRPRYSANVLVENATRAGHERPLVFMPVFGGEEPRVEAFDEANAALWRSLGFDVAPVPGWGVAAGAGGALRCAVKVLRRDAPCLQD